MQDERYELAEYGPEGKKVLGYMRMPARPIPAPTRHPTELNPVAFAVKQCIAGIRGRKLVKGRK